MTVYVYIALEHVTKAQRGSKVYLYSFFNLGTRWSGWSTPRPGCFTLGKVPVSII